MNKICLLFCLLMGGLPCLAFPPTPDYTIYGLVKDQSGNVLASGAGDVIVYQAGEEVLRREIKSVDPNINYTLPIRMDLQLFGSDNYKTGVIRAGSAIQIRVELNNTIFLPIEIQGDLTTGVGGDDLNLDLTLGVDSDNDGLPDIWEQWQLFSAGIYPGVNGWALENLSFDGDFDGDGQSDGFEYIAGTYAGDAEDSFFLNIKERSDQAVQFDFYQVTGKSYTIEASDDLVTWRRVSFSVANGDSASFYSATASGIVSAATVQDPTAKFFKLSVR